MISLIAALCFAQSDRLGLSCNEILSMKPEKWIDYYCQRKTMDDPITSGEAAATYAGCLRERYKPLLAKRPQAERNRLARLEKDAVAFKNACFEIQYIQGGGGTIFSHLQRLTVIDDASLMEDVLRGVGSRTLKTDAAVAAAWKRADAWVAARVSRTKPLEYEGSGFGLADLRKAGRQAASALASLKEDVSKRPLAERSRAAEYAIDWIEPIVGE
ncbi:MAG TPA: hypothetical protein PLL78_09205 [Fimbriimonadaceae bacterium]|nr:hypothetical protein [Fimbriimonadaceae bacterium]HRJ96851.1 hypothetical protein [Fimbriimonadaceae bacterium]